MTTSIEESNRLLKAEFNLNYGEQLLVYSEAFANNTLPEVYEVLNEAKEECMKIF